LDGGFEHFLPEIGFRRLQNGFLAVFMPGQAKAAGPAFAREVGKLNFFRASALCSSLFSYLRFILKMGLM
jgi:hypothetical protein